MWNSDHLRWVDAFSPQARSMKGHFDQQFKDPRRVQSSRFVWDYWHVPDQYTLIRTPAYEYFPKEIYQKFHKQLVQYGREVLGCHDVSPPWLSYYVDGCSQEVHADQPHGPWAFVYSLTEWEQRLFVGGETFLWKDFSKRSSSKFVEHESFVQRIEPKFNRLTVFDPSIPHGVRPVQGVKDPMKARIVIHGWFVNPRPYIQGKLSPECLEEKVSDLGNWLQKQSGIAQGWCVFRFEVGASGKVKGMKSLWGRMTGDSSFSKKLVKEITSWKFDPQDRNSSVTLPLFFE